MKSKIFRLVVFKKLCILYELPYKFTSVQHYNASKVELSQYSKLVYCILHATCSLYCNTDVVIIKPVTGRASICSASRETTRRLIALGSHIIQKKKFVNIHMPVIQF